MRASTGLQIEDLSFAQEVLDAEQVHGGFYYGGLSSLFQRLSRRYGFGGFGFDFHPPQPSTPLPDGPIPVEPDLPDGSPNPGNFPPAQPPFAQDGDVVSYKVQGNGFEASFISAVSFW